MGAVLALQLIAFFWMSLTLIKIRIVVETLYVYLTVKAFLIHSREEAEPSNIVAIKDGIPRLKMSWKLMFLLMGVVLIVIWPIPMYTNKTIRYRFKLPPEEVTGIANALKKQHEKPIQTGET